MADPAAQPHHMGQIHSPSAEDQDRVVGIEKDREGEMDEDDPLIQFAPVIAAINFDRLPHLAVSLRKSALSGERNGSTCINEEDMPMSCTVIFPPLAGSYNILFPLLFSDGVRWIFKVPMTGYRGRFDDVAAQALESEAMIMRFIRRDTTIPVPEVYSYDTSLGNEVNCPFIMMEHLQGRPLHELWFGQWSSKVARKKFRTRVLQELAAAMAQLNNFRYSQGGSLLFNHSGNVTGIGPSRVVDHATQFSRLGSDDNDGSAIFCVKPPCNDAKSFITYALDRRFPCPDPAKYREGAFRLLRLFIDWLPLEDHAVDTPQFVLAHPDFALQNILVSEDGTVNGIIDWDGAGTVPYCIANYPLWLMRDWDPLMYNYDFEERKIWDKEGQPEDTPEQLAFWRATYAYFLKKHDLTHRDGVSAASGHGDRTGTVMPEDASSVSVSRSPVFWSLAVAANDPLSLHENVGRIFSEIERLTAPGWDKAHSSHSTVFEESLSYCFKPVCSLVQESLHCIAKILHMNDNDESLAGIDSLSATIELRLNGRPRSRHGYVRTVISAAMDFIHKNVSGEDSDPQPATVKPAIADGGDMKAFEAHGRIHKALGKVMEHLPKKKVKESRENTEKESAKYTEESSEYNLKDSNKDNEHQSTLVGTCPSDIVKARRGPIQNALHRVKLLYKKTKESSTDEEPKVLPIDACSNKYAKPGGRIRRAFQRPVKFLRHRKLGNSTECTDPSPEVVEGSASEKDEPSCGLVGRIIRQAFPCLRKNKMESSEVQENSSLTEEKVQYLCFQFINELEHAGFSAIQIQKRRTFFEDAIKQMIQNLQDDLYQLDQTATAPESPIPTMNLQDKQVVDGEEETEELQYASSIFAQITVANALVDNNLKDEMGQRLKEGFDSLLASAV